MPTSLQIREDGGPDRRKRHPPKLIGQAGQQAHRRAIAARPRLTRADWCVLSALRSMTLDYHRLTDQIYSDDLATAAHVSHGQLYTSLRSLGDADVILWEPSGGRKPALHGFPPSDTSTVQPHEVDG